jgi:hypothetical protein
VTVEELIERLAALPHSADVEMSVEADYGGMVALEIGRVYHVNGTVYIEE